MNLIARTRFRYRAWRYARHVEPAEIALVRRTLRRGQRAVDIGAHKGAFTYWMHRTVGPPGQVFAFEPQPELSHYLEQAKQGLGLENVTVVPAGLSARDGSMCITRPTETPSPSARLVAQDDGQATAVRVQVYSLDSFFRDDRQPPIQLIKCDVEGHELEVFRGAVEILREDRPVLLFECEQRHHQDQETEAVFSFLREIGYEGQCFNQGRLRPFTSRDLQGQSADAAAYVNNFCFRPVRRAA